MDLKSLQKLPFINREGSNEDIPITNLFVVRWDRSNSERAIEFRAKAVDRQEEMRFDILSFNLYGTSKHADFLAVINDYVNPFNLKEGDIIIHPLKEEDIKRYLLDVDNTRDVAARLLNRSKSKRKDKNRKNFLEDQRAGVSPNINQSSKSAITVKDGRVIINQNFG